MNAPPRRLSALLALGLFGVTACGDEPATTSRRRPAARAKPAAKAKTDDATEGAIDLSKVPAKYRTLDWDSEDELDRAVRDTRDPFRIHMEPVEKETVADETTRPKRTGALATIPVKSLRLTAIITGTAIHKAMVIDPRGVGHVIRAGDIIGEDAYRVTRITRNELVLKRLFAKPDDKGEDEIVFRLLTDEELEEL